MNDNDVALILPWNINVLVGYIQPGLVLGVNHIHVLVDHYNLCPVVIFEGICRTDVLN